MISFVTVTMSLITGRCLRSTRPVLSVVVLTLGRIYIYIYIFAWGFVFNVTCYATRYYNPGHDRAVYCVGDVRVVAKLVSFGPSCFCLFLTSLRYCRVAMALEGIVLLPYGTCLGNHAVQEATAATPAPRAVVQGLSRGTDAVKERGQIGPGAGRHVQQGHHDMTVAPDVHTKVDVQHSVSQRGSAWKQQVCKPGVITAVETHAPATDHFIPHANFVRLLKESGSLNRRCSCKRSWAQVDAGASDVQVRISAKPLAH